VWGGAGRTGDPLRTNAVFPALHVTRGLKLGQRQGLALSVHGRLLKRTLLLALPVIPIRAPTCALLGPALARGRGQL